MNDGRIYVSALEPQRPAHESGQDSAIEWLAAAHAVAQQTALAKGGVAPGDAFHPGASVPPEDSGSRASDLGAFNLDAFNTQMRKFITRFGCPPGKIAKRGHALADFLHMDWERMEIFDITRHPEGASITQRNAFFHATARQVFARFYEGVEKAPDDIVHVSCTGYVSPSAAQEIVVEKGWRECTQVTHAYHMGCYAAIPALRMAVGYLSGAGAGLGRRSRVDVVHTELCTLHLNPLKHSPEQLVVQSLFADGFIRYGVVSNEDVARASGRGGFFEILALKEEMVPESRDAMTWDLTPVGMAMTLSREVPRLIASSLPGFLERLFRQGGEDFGAGREGAVFAIHPGGPKIIEGVRELLGLTPRQVSWSEKVLLECGNMSSATLPHIWDEVARDASVEQGTLVVGLAFGPGLSICGALMRKRV